MIIDELRSGQEHGLSTTSARLTWEGGEFRLVVTMPAELAAGRPDASPFLCPSVLLAMRLAEDLEVRGPVSPRLLERVPRVVDLYARWDPRLFRSRVRARGELEPAPRAGGIGCFLSRGVDALYSAASPRGLPGPLTRLVFCDRLEPIHSAEVRAEEVRLATEAATRLGLPLVLIESNIRQLTDPIVRDWEDMAGAGLSFLATSMAGALGHMVIPSSDGPKTIGACGTSPLLDPLFSTAEVEVEHDAPRTRTAKVAWLARERPDLLPYLKVCYHEDRADNCGRCSKCLVTMLALEAVGALHEATGFPAAFDLDVLARQRPPSDLNARLEFSEAERALRDRGASRDLIAAVRGLLERAAERDPSSIQLPDDSPAFRRRASREALLLLRGSSEPLRQQRSRPPRRDGAGRPHASVIVLAREGATGLRETVGSALAQSESGLELLIVAEGSSAVGAQLPGDPRLRILRHARFVGPCAALNRALAAARAPFVSQLDVGDCWEPDYLASVLPRFQDQAVGLVYTNATILGHPAGLSDGVEDASDDPLDEFPRIASKNPVPCPTATMRTAAVRAVGGYAWWLRQCGDHHLYMKLARAGWRFAYLDRRLVRRRWLEPEPGTGPAGRSQELWQLAMFGSFVARHPRTRGPRRQVRVRVRRELEQLREIARLRSP